jgi:hypothetical protein
MSSSDTGNLQLSAPKPALVREGAAKRELEGKK